LLEQELAQKALEFSQMLSEEKVTWALDSITQTFMVPKLAHLKNVPRQLDKQILLKETTNILVTLIPIHTLWKSKVLWPDQDQA
jgi:hypothetical protein